MPIARLDVKTTALLVVDIQEKLLPVMHNAEAVVSQTARLLDGAAVLDLPVIVTEQYRKGLGVTVPELSEKLLRARSIHEKLMFSALIEPVARELASLGARQVLVCGIEAHVCIMQTCLDLAREGFLPFVVTDAIGSRRESDHHAALQRLIQAGVIPTTVESALLEMVHEGGTDTFKRMLPVIR